MDSLPVELLSRIFINVLPPHLDDARYSVDDPASVQASVCCVCHAWNHVAKSTPRFWTFIKITYCASSHVVMKRRLELAGKSPLNVVIQYGREGRVGSSREILALLLERVSQWNTLRVEVSVWKPAFLREWFPAELPNVVGLSLKLDVLAVEAEDDADARYPFISAPRLTFCSSNSPIYFPLTHCPLLQEYRVSGIGFDGDRASPRTLVWRELVKALSEKCPRVEILEVREEGHISVWAGEDHPPKDWPALMSLTTLRFATGSSCLNIDCLLTRLKVPLLHLVEFQAFPTSYPFRAMDFLIPKFPFPVNNDGQIRFSGMNMSDLKIIVSQIHKARDFRIEVDVTSIVVGDSRSWDPRSETFGLSSTAISELRSGWEWVGRYLPEVSWVILSDEGEGGFKRLGGADLSFDDAVAYLNNRMRLQLKT